MRTAGPSLSRPSRRLILPAGDFAASVTWRRYGFAPVHPARGITPRPARTRTLGRVSRRTQKIVIIVVALALVVPFGAVGLAQIFGSPDEREQAQQQEQQEQQEDPDDNRPSVDPDSQPDPAPTEKPEAPAELTEQSAAGAEATAEYQMTSYAYMMATGDTSVWEQLVSEDCQVCTSFLDNAQQLHDQEGYQIGGEFEVTDTAFDGEGDPPEEGTVTVDVTQTEAQIIDDPNLAPADVPPFTGQMEVQLAWDGERWTVSDMAVVGEE